VLTDIIKGLLGLSCTYCCIVKYSALQSSGALLYSLLSRIYLFYVQSLIDGGSLSTLVDSFEKLAV